MTRALRSGLRVLAYGAAWASGLCFLAIFAVNLLNITGRYSGQFALLWAFDLSRLLFVWTVFLGAAAATYFRTHLALDFIRDRFPPAARRQAIAAGHLLLILLLIVLCIEGWRFAWIRMAIPYLQLDVPQGYAYLALPVAAGLMILFALENLVDGWRGHSASRPMTEAE